ncbi:MAG: hypothetical protein KKH91_05790 [Elusimicrobia bacterium]|nr:hypothetical protein [Elusimicrobiota bacterium]
MEKILPLIIALPVAFVIFLLIFWAIYRIGGMLAAKGANSKGKYTTYACGEDINSIKIPFGYELFFLFAIFFTIMHVTALVIATLPKGPVVYFGIFYLVMIFISVLTLLTKEK